MSYHLFTADIHLGSFAKLEEDISFEVLEWIYEVADEHGVSTLNIAGDIFKSSNPADRVKSRLLSFLLKRKKEKFSTRYLVGNHDYYLLSGYDYKNRIAPDSAADILEEVKKILGDDFYVISKPLSLDSDGNTFHYLPFGNNYRAIENEINSYLDLEGNIFLVGHLQITGTRRDNNTVEKTGVNLSVFGNDRLTTVLGHFHNKQKFYNSMYCGSPYPQKRSEVGDKGIWILDVVDNKIKDSQFIINDFSPRYVDLEIDLVKNTIEVYNSHIKVGKNPKLKNIVEAVTGNIVTCNFNVGSIADLENFYSKNENFISAVKSNSYSYDERIIVVRDDKIIEREEESKRIGFSEGFIQFLDSCNEMKEIKEMAKIMSNEIGL